MSEVDITSCIPIVGWMNEWELEWLAQMALKSSRIIEIGSWCGRSTRALALHTKGTVWAVDSWQPVFQESGMTASAVEAEMAYNTFMGHMKEFVDVGRVQVVRARSLIATKQLLYTFGRGSFDFIFIDGDHSFQAVALEIEICKQLLAPSGILSGHDNWMYGVKQAIERLAPGYECPAGSIWMKQL